MVSDCREWRQVVLEARVHNGLQCWGPGGEEEVEKEEEEET
jgi:hypothetical protein